MTMNRKLCRDDGTKIADWELRIGVYRVYSNPCRSCKFFTPPQPSPRVRSGSKKFTNDLGWLYYNVEEQVRVVAIERIGEKPNNTVFFRGQQEE